MSAQTQDEERTLYVDLSSRQSMALHILSLGSLSALSCHRRRNMGLAQHSMPRTPSLVVTQLANQRGAEIPQESICQIKQLKRCTAIDWSERVAVQKIPQSRSWATRPWSEWHRHSMSRCMGPVGSAAVLAGSNWKPSDWKTKAWRCPEYGLAFLEPNPETLRKHSHCLSEQFLNI